MAKQPLLPKEIETDPKTGETTDPNEQAALEKFYKDDPQAMRKWVDTDADAFSQFPDAESDEEDGTDSDLETDEPSDTEPPVKNAFELGDDEDFSLDDTGPDSDAQEGE